MEGQISHGINFRPSWFQGGITQPALGTEITDPEERLPCWSTNISRLNNPCNLVDVVVADPHGHYQTLVRSGRLCEEIKMHHYSNLDSEWWILR